ncbi:efflux RND transporter periplasmic adaptor subunit [Myxococcus sp. RHSTA-1-4]|uniref:efflux RND transporter periplasmic adaptor subunit n=1 Tax=Myxococcus sp. RHSTA-1-4 TaxID=2874601 RepID=UPI001CBAFC93|nr:efflux RND transporter periplasmic adaptor subunit [Myxococcus sp. RHSTA-1-4]MBZ4421750.1 efflux RND transporter periplasmic adaptor subunit [Myxococcus sp. RHSTA-1-4]
MSPSLPRRLARAWPLLLVAAVLGGAFFLLRMRPVAAQVVRVDVGPVAREAVGTGTLESEAQVSTAFTLSGRITGIRVNEGDTVRPGDVLATLDASEQERHISLAQRGVEFANSGVEKSEAEVQRARAALEAALADQRRSEALHASGVVPDAERDARNERAARARAELDAALAAQRQGARNVGVAQETVRLQARRGEETVLRSPLEGVVVKRLHEPGDVVGPGNVVLVIASTRKVWARVWMDETVLHLLHEGQEGRVVLRGDPSRSYRARVDRIAVEADRQTYEVLVDVALLERPARLVFGQRADAFVMLEARPAAPRVPQGACDVAAGQCFVAKGERVTRADVRFGLSGNEWVEVLSGLQRGDAVLVPAPGGAGLPEGRRVAGLTP